MLTFAAVDGAVLVIAGTMLSPPPLMDDMTGFEAELVQKGLESEGTLETGRGGDDTSNHEGLNNNDPDCELSSPKRGGHSGHSDETADGVAGLWEVAKGRRFQVITKTKQTNSEKESITHIRRFVRSFPAPTRLQT